MLTFTDPMEPPSYTDTKTAIQNIPVTIHTILDDHIAWYSEFGSLKFDPDDSYFGPARVNALGVHIPVYQNGDTNWDVGLACVFDY